MSLSLLLREGTEAVHRAAESTPFIKAFLASRLTADDYRELLARLYPVYVALEAACDSQPVPGSIHSPALARTEALERDLTFYYGDDWRAHVSPTPATQSYVDRIEALAHDWPTGIVAHHYTRYLGDLSGGQALKRVAIKAFKLTDGRGVAFYEFPAIPKINEFKAQYRAKLDALPVTEDEAQRLVEEAKRAFLLNTQIFEELTPAAA